MVGATRERPASVLVMQGREAGAAGAVCNRVPLPTMRGNVADHRGRTIKTIGRPLTRLRAETLIEIAPRSELVVAIPNPLRSLGLG